MNTFQYNDNKTVKQKIAMICTYKNILLQIQIQIQIIYYSPFVTGLFLHLPMCRGKGGMLNIHLRHAKTLYVIFIWIHSSRFYPRSSLPQPA